ncbi:MAG: hypothetical protein ISS26_06110 [Candidatus Omnitrophica bacterium]|nr:hypothetical protein [Candidatus Omnitrophota bacterium]
MSVVGEVCYCNHTEFQQYKCGIRFLTLHMKHKKAIARLSPDYNAA